MRIARFAAFASALLLLALASTAIAAVRAVDIANFAFSPPSVTIAVGDMVTWTNKDAAAHSAVVSGVGQTAVLLQNQSGSLMFNAAGTWSYVCGVHGRSMSGTVIVRAAATPPPTPPPTPQPTVAPTVQPTSAPTESPSPTPTAAATSAAPTAATPSVAVAASSAPAPAPDATNDGAGATPILIGAAVVAALGVVAFALARLRR